MRRFVMRRASIILCFGLPFGITAALLAQTGSKPATHDTADRHLGGEPDSIVQVANLVYAGTKSSHCFSDHFLIQAQKDSVISTSRRFHAVKLADDELFGF